MLNFSGKRGSTTGNMLGVLSNFYLLLLFVAIMYGMSEWAIEKTGLDTLTNKRDYAGPLVCGFTSGLVFKSTGKFLCLLSLFYSWTSWCFCCWFDWYGCCCCNSLYSKYTLT